MPIITASQHHSPISLTDRRWLLKVPYIFCRPWCLLTFLMVALALHRLVPEGPQHMKRVKGAMIVDFFATVFSGLAGGRYPFTTLSPCCLAWIF